MKPWALMLFRGRWIVEAVSSPAGGQLFCRLVPGKPWSARWLELAELSQFEDADHFDQVLDQILGG